MQVPPFHPDLWSSLFPEHLLPLPGKVVELCSSSGFVKLIGNPEVQWFQSEEGPCVGEEMGQAVGQRAWFHCSLSMWGAGGPQSCSQQHAG